MKEEKLKLSLYTNNMITENPKESTPPKKGPRTNIQIILLLTKYKVNIRKSTIFLHTSNEWLEKKNLKTIPFTLAPKNEIRRHESNKVSERSTGWKLQTADERNQRRNDKWKDKPCSWIETFSLVRMSIFPKMIYTFNTFPNSQ